MAVRLPRFVCPGCGREVAGRSTTRMGYASLADHKRDRRVLVLCPWSESHVPLKDAVYRQERLPEDAPLPGVSSGEGERIPLF